MSAALVYLVFCICLHACSGRPLGLLDKQETVKGSLHLSDKRFQKIETVLPAQRFAINSEEAERRKVQTEPRNNFVAAEKDRNEPNDNKGKKVELLNTEDLHQFKTADLQAQKTKARQMTESLQSDNSSEKSMVSEENNVGEDIDVMDYALPHRKPPIHNKEP